MWVVAIMLDPTALDKALLLFGLSFLSYKMEELDEVGRFHIWTTAKVTGLSSVPSVNIP